MAVSRETVVLGCLGGLALSLLLVGVASATLLRHVIQILPIVVAMALLSKRADYGACAALPIFAFWILVVLLIWLFLLGVSGFANGHYSAVEIVLTVFMVTFAVFGMAGSISLWRPLSILGRALVTCVFILLQVVAMWVSLTPVFANR